MKRTLSKFTPTLPQHPIVITRPPDANESLAINLGGIGNSLKKKSINQCPSVHFWRRLPAPDLESSCTHHTT